MTDKYAELRAALEAGPTPGPWFAHNSLAFAVATVGMRRIASDAEPAADPAGDIRYIAAANPEAIRALLAERDALREALLWNAAALQAACKSGAVTEQDEFIAESGALTAREILDMADAALAQQEGK